MNFGFTEEQELLRKTARDFLAEHSPMQRVREVMQEPEGHDASLWRRMSELGWMGLALPEEHGGADASLVELCIVLEELGRRLAPVPFLPTVLSAAAVQELGTDAQRAEWLPGFAAGRLRATLALAEERGRGEAGAIHLAADRDGEGWRLSGTKLFVADGLCADLLLVVARTGGAGETGLAVFTVPRIAAGLVVTPMAGVDLLRPLSRVDLRDVRLPSGALLGEAEDGWPAITRVLDRGRVMVCAEMVGAAGKCLEDSVRYARERVQFDKPIGADQAIQHKCADMLCEVESARSLTYYAAWAATGAVDEASLATAMAKSYTGDAFRHVSAENIQIHGGVGFTWEYDCHLYFKRAKSDEVWLGDGTQQRERVATLLPI